MRRVFVSYARTDRYFVDLLLAILNYHNIEYWADCQDLRPGQNFEGDTERALRECTDLVLVVSANTVGSKWIPFEIGAFRKSASDKRIFPLMIDTTNINEVGPGLNGLQQIHLYRCYLTGLRELLHCFGTELFKKIEKRSGANRRNSQDRRTSPQIQRMRRGFWNAFHEKTGCDKFELLEPNYLTRFHVLDALAHHREITCYGYHNISSSTPIEPQEALEEATLNVWREVSTRYSKIKAVILVELVAEELKRSFTVIPKDRRSLQRRNKA